MPNLNDKIQTLIDDGTFSYAEDILIEKGVVNHLLPDGCHLNGISFDTPEADSIECTILITAEHETSLSEEEEESIADSINDYLVDRLALHSTLEKAGIDPDLLDSWVIQLEVE